MSEEHKTIRFQVGESWAGVYDPAVKYRYAKVVQDPTGLSLYRSLKNDNQGHPLTDTRWWFLIINLSHIKRVADGIIELNDTMSQNEKNRQDAELTRGENEEARERAFTANEGSEAESSPADGSRWGRFLHNEAKRQSNAEAAEGSLEGSEPDDGSRFGAFLAAEVLRNRARQLAEGSEAESEPNDGTRWGAYLAAEILRDQARQLVEGTAESEPNDGSRWGAYLAAEVLRDQARQLAEGTAESEPNDGSRWGAYLAAEALRNQARQLVEGTAESEPNDGSRWGAYLAAEVLRNQARQLAEGSEASSVAGDGSRWGAFKSAEAARDALAAALRTMLEQGEVVPAIAKTLAAFAERNSLSVEDTWSGAVRTTAGETSVDSSKQAQLVAIVAKERFYASALLFTDFNLLPTAVQLGSGYYFLVPALPFGTFGTANEPNGVLFTGRDRSNLKPTVRFKRLSDGVPTSLADGDACAYTDSNGYRFYTTTEPGYLIVDGITYADTCAHTGWSGRYDEFQDPADAAGSSIAIASIIHKIHDFDAMLAVGGVGDSIKIISKTQAEWTRRCNRIKPTWETTSDEEGTSYTHSAVISTMLTDGSAQLEDKTPLNVAGTTVSYTDDQAEPTEQYVEFQLATVATGRENISPLCDIEDWGLDMLIGIVGSAYITMLYAQGYPDSLAALVNGGLEAVLSIIAQLFAHVNSRVDTLYGQIAEGFRSLTVDNLTVNNSVMRYDNSGNRVLTGEGAPAVMADFVSQLYNDTTTNDWYFATGTTAVSQWRKINLQ